MATKYTKRPQNKPIARPLQDLLKITQIGIFGLKIYHLATLQYHADKAMNDFSKFLQ
jgi:hypothetical protein